MATSATMASPTKNEFTRGVLARAIEKFRAAPVESLALTVFGPWLMSTVIRGSWRHLTEHPAEGKKFAIARKISTNDAEEVDKARVIKYRGKTFMQVESQESVDLSMWGALPYWFPVCMLGMEGFFMLRDGTEYFKRRGYTPAQRHSAQAYFFFAILPLVDLLAGDDWANPTKDQQKNRRLAYRFRTPLYLWVLFEFILTIATFRIVLDGKNGLTKRSRMALFMQLGLFNGVFGINVAHELLHKNNKFEKALAWALLTNVNYCHWSDEHEVGHHANVATPLDPATSREGETVYQFLPRTFVGSFKSSCEIEARRLLKEENTTTWYTPKNRIIRGIIGSAIWAITLSRLSKSVWAIPLFYFQGMFSAHLLEVVNYIEHFGLSRKQDPETGEYEPVDPTHSWNAPNRFSNTILFKLQRHSDHHTFPTRPYEILRNFVESPQMPTGYIGMFVLAMVPPAYFWVMTPLLDARKLEFNHEREPTEEELSKVQELKLLARSRVWRWTLSTFAFPTAGLILAQYLKAQ